MRSANPPPVALSSSSSLRVVRQLSKHATAPLKTPRFARGTWWSDLDNDEHEQADLAGYHGDARRVQDERAAARSRAKAHMFARNFLKGVAGVLVTAGGFWLCWKSLDSRFPAFTTAREDISRWSPNCTAQSSGQLSHAQVQALDACWHAEFERMQRPLVRAVRSAFPNEGFFDSLPRLYLGFNVAILGAVACYSYWLVCYLDLLPAELLENFYFLLGVYKLLDDRRAQAFVVLLVAFVTLPAVALHTHLAELCALMRYRQHAFYAEVQRAAVYCIREPTFRCELDEALAGRGNASLDSLGVLALLSTKWVQVFVVLPMFGLLKRTWAKALQQARERRNQEERYCDVVNFSLNMVQSGPDGACTFLFRTFCELPTKQLVQNDALREALKAAARCTEERYPLLHTLHKRSRRQTSYLLSLNILCLNKISQQVGAAFFSMDNSLRHGTHVATVDYCFALTSERYKDDKGEMTHEDKLRCMLVKQDVLETIIKDGNATAPLDYDADITYAGARLHFPKRNKDQERWQTMKAMACAWHDKDNVREAGMVPAVHKLSLPVVLFT